MSLKLSIITINLNNLPGLQKTMQSVFDQTFSDYEYIIIDGGSTDGSKEQIKKYENKLVYWVSEKDNGIYNAMNKGILMASGDYLLFLNSGDHFYEQNICEKIFTSTNEDADIIYGDLKINFPDGKETVFRVPQPLTIDYLIVGTLFHPAAFIHKRLFIDYGLYNENFTIVSDWIFFFKVIVTGNAKLCYKDFIFSVYHKDGISSKIENYETIKNERETIINQELPKVVKDLVEKYNQSLARNTEMEANLMSKRFLLRELIHRMKISFRSRLKLVLI